LVEDGSDESNPRVFLDISIGESSPEKVVFELFANVVPRTAENFRAYCTGEKGISKSTGRPLHYKGTVFDHIIRGSYAHGGDFSEGEDFTGGESIYGGCFKDENFQLRHTEPGMLSMGNGGPNTNGSRFHLTFAPVKWFDGSHVVFGKVIQGMSTIKRMSQIGISSGVVRITDCGQIPEDKGIVFQILN
ncbi:uncharacterized protein LOC143631054, partial [Bidens hawaiensis]|uniref:uncharacterized protein LOC143631054 n=1 Tax=Bidens hawaiensis TaxID=980011 RepID=UPI0040498AF0